MPKTLPVPNLPISTVDRLKDIFLLNQWHLEGDDLFDRFSETLRVLNEEQQELLLELTRAFLKVDLGSYHYHIMEALSKVPADAIGAAERIYVLPLMPKDDYGKSKSSSSLTYLFKDSAINTYGVLADKSVIVLDKPSGLPSSFNDGAVRLFLVDDFVGSGETAEKSLEYVVDELGIEKDKIVVLVLVAQRESFQRIQASGISIVSSVIRPKGISSRYEDPQKQRYLGIMVSIENLLIVDARFRLGYRQSEALVKMIRTPNNTFPVFWLRTKLRDGRNFVPPFPR